MFLRLIGTVWNDRDEGDLRGSQREGDVCISGQAKPKSSAAVLHTTSGLKMAVNASERDCMCLFACGFSSYQFIQSKAQAAVFVQDEEAPLPFLTSRHSKQNHCSSLFFTTEKLHVCVSPGRTLDRCIGLSKSVPSGAKHSQPP